MYPEEIKPECPQCTRNGFIPCPLSWDGAMLPEFLSHMVPLQGVSHEGEFCTRFGRRKWSSTFFVTVAAGTLPCRFKSPLLGMGQHLTLSFPSSRHSLTSASESWTKCVSAPGLKGTTFPYKLPLRYQDRKWWGRRLVPAHPDWFQLSSQVEVPVFLSNHQSGQPQWIQAEHQTQTITDHTPTAQLSPLWEFPLHKNPSVLLTDPALVKLWLTLHPLWWTKLLCPGWHRLQKQVYLPDMRQGKCWHAMLTAKRVFRQKLNEETQEHFSCASS